jgi:sensor domain CHASE-containing protein
MRLKQKSAWIVVGSFLTFGLLAFTLFNSFLLREFKTLEDQQAARNVGRVSEAFQQEIRSLIERTRDWAVWDDAYRFVEKHDDEFIESNLSYDAVKSINFNHIVFLSKTANISYALQLDFGAETIGPLSPAAQSVLVDTRVFGSILDQHSVGGGLLTIDGKTYLVAASPITDSAAALPPNGVLIFTRELTEDSVARFGEQTKLQIQRASGTTPSQQIESRSILLDPTQAFQVAAVQLTTTELIGGLIVNDIFGNEVMNLRIPMRRDLHFQGVQIRTYVSYGLALLALMTAGLVIILIDRLVISRIARIGNQLNCKGAIIRGSC